MILKAKERGDAPQLARYLLTMRDNDHVELHEVRGFASDDLKGAFCEADAIAKGTRCKNYLFSISLNPPEGANVSVGAFEQAAAEIERKLGLEDQPRAIVFHEKDGRRHAHVVWSRIDAGRMRAINLPHYKIKLRDVSRQLYLRHGELFLRRRHGIRAFVRVLCRAGIRFSRRTCIGYYVVSFLGYRVERQLGFGAMRRHARGATLAHSPAAERWRHPIRAGLVRCPEGSKALWSSPWAKPWCGPGCISRSMGSRGERSLPGHGGLGGARRLPRVAGAGGQTPASGQPAIRLNGSGMGSMP